MKPHNSDSRVNTKSSPNAFTLIEAVVALSVFAASAVAIFGVLDVCARAAHHNKMLTRAVLLAETKLAELRLESQTAFEETRGEEEPFQWTRTVRPTDRAENLAAVRVRVVWTEQNRPQQYELLSLLRMKTFE